LQYFEKFLISDFVEMGSSLELKKLIVQNEKYEG